MRDIGYVKGTLNRGFRLFKKANGQLVSFLHFPITPSKGTWFTDVNWDSQDKSIHNPLLPYIEIFTFKSRSTSVLIIMFNDPLYWTTKRQNITARILLESEIYASSECHKELIRLRLLLLKINILQLSITKA